MNKRANIPGYMAGAFTLTLLLLAASVAFFNNYSPASAAVPPTGKVSAPIQERPHVSTWVDIAPFPTVTIDFTPVAVPLKLKRAGAAAFPSNGKVYVLGGRHGADGQDISMRQIWEYTPGSPGSWVAKASLLDSSPPGSRYTANMAVATLNGPSGARIYAIGGSSIDSDISATVRVYDPVADSLTTLTASDNWPASPARIPGGWAVTTTSCTYSGGSEGWARGAYTTRRGCSTRWEG